MAEDSAIFDSAIARFRLMETGGKPDPSGLAIEVHIIAPGWGSSGYYSESVLQNACKSGVYPVGMHMHLDHPTREAEKSQPARTISGQSPLVATLTKAGHYETEGWDKSPENPTGAGVYATARVLPRYVEDIKALADSIGISHYVSGTSENGEACGKKGKIIMELSPDPLNTVDFVTVPGAGGHYRTLFNESKKRDSMENRQRQENTVREEDYPWDQCVADQTKEYGDVETAKRVCAAIKNGTIQHAVAYGIAPNVKEARDMIAQKIKTEPLVYYLTGRAFEQMKEDYQRKRKMVTLDEVKKDPALMEQVKKTVMEEAKVEEQLADLRKKADSASKLEEQLSEARKKIAEGAARTYVTAEIAKTKLPATVGKALTESLLKQAPLAEDGSLDTAKFGITVSEAIKGKQEEIAAILKESGATGMHDNGVPAFEAGTVAEVQKAKEELRDSYVAAGKTREEANRLVGIKEA